MTSPASPLLDDAPLPPSPRRPAGPLTFRGPAEDPWEGAPPVGATLTPEEAGEGTSLDDQLAGSPSASGETPEWNDEGDESPPRSSRGSSADPASVRPLTARAQRAAARQAVKVAGSMAHTMLARDEAAQAVGLFLVDDETAAQIGDPLARIVARRAPLDGAIANPDVADGIAAMLGVANFVSKQIVASSTAAALRAGVVVEQPAQDV